MEERVVLIAVLKRRRDLTILLKEHWYHLPAERMPGRDFCYIAFYGPAALGREGRRIRYYAKVARSALKKRRDIFPREPGHPRADEAYRQIFFKRVQKLPWPIRNVPPRRVCFGYTTLQWLKNAKNILAVYGVFPAEEVMARGLKRARLPAVPQYRVSGEGKRYRLDFAVFCRHGAVAIECDNLKAHASKLQRRRDKAKDKFLKRHSWTVVRLKETAIRSSVQDCIERVRRAALRRGGASRTRPLFVR